MQIYAKLTTSTRWLHRHTTERSSSDTRNYLTFLSTSETFTPWTLTLGSHSRVTLYHLLGSHSTIMRTSCACTAQPSKLPKAWSSCATRDELCRLLSRRDESSVYISASNYHRQLKGVKGFSALSSLAYGFLITFHSWGTLQPAALPRQPASRNRWRAVKTASRL